MSLEFTAQASVQTARIEFAIGASQTPIECSDIELSCEGQEVAPTEWRPAS